MRLDLAENNHLIAHLDAEIRRLAGHPHQPVHWLARPFDHLGSAQERGPDPKTHRRRHAKAAPGWSNLGTMSCSLPAWSCTRYSVAGDCAIVSGPVGSDRVDALEPALTDAQSPIISARSSDWIVFCSAVLS